MHVTDVSSGHENLMSLVSLADRFLIVYGHLLVAAFFWIKE
jgi:hypothetical protein